MRKCVKRALIAGVGPLAIMGGFSGVEAAVAHADSNTQHLTSHVERHCAPIGAKQGVFCYAD
jgi:hypothetical protein